jgi:CheY-like chemotaxis protein
MVVPIAGAVAHGRGSTRPVILTVDDEPSIRSAVFVIFENEFDVLEAPDGQTALDLVRSRRVDLVLLDLRMPGLSGLTLLERLLTVKRDVKVILVTAVDDARTAAAAMKIGASDYLTKPFDVDELDGMVRRALGVRTDRTTHVAHAVVTGPQVGICTSVAVVLGARCGLAVEAVVSEALNAPDYHSGMQRFISEDPIDFADGDTNLYTYARNNPTQFVDPTGTVIEVGLLAYLGACTAVGVVLDIVDLKLSGRKPDLRDALGNVITVCSLGALRVGRAPVGRAPEPVRAPEPSAPKAPGPFVPRGKAPDQVAPGTVNIKGTYDPSPNGPPQPYSAHYDQYGRQIGRTDYTNVQGHGNPHHHVREYGPGYPRGKESGPLPGPHPLDK